MNFHILTLFPDMVENGLKTSITGRAIESGAISVEAVDIRDYTTDKHRHVDDAPYGGGAGMVIQPAPVCDAYEALCKKLGKRPRVIYMTPQGRVFNQSIAEELAKEENLVFLCGHYEGIDERALELIQAEYLSAGDFGPYRRRTSFYGDDRLYFPSGTGRAGKWGLRRGRVFLRQSAGISSVHKTGGL